MTHHLPDQERLAARGEHPRRLLMLATLVVGLMAVTSVADASTTCPDLPDVVGDPVAAQVVLGGTRYPRPEKRLPVRIGLSLPGIDAVIGPFAMETMTFTVVRAETGAVLYQKVFDADQLAYPGVSAVGWRPPSVRRTYLATVVAGFSFTDAAGATATCTSSASRRFLINPKVADPGLGSRFTRRRLTDDVARAEAVFTLRYEMRDQTGACNVADPAGELGCQDFITGIDTQSVSLTLYQGRREVTTWDGTGDSFDGIGSAVVRVPYSLLSFGSYRWVAKTLHPMTLRAFKTSGVMQIVRRRG